MKVINKNTVIYLLIIISIIGCASAGREFTYQNRTKLELGTTTYEYALEIFGEPASSSETTNEDGVYKTIGYTYASRGMMETAARALTLEFKQGLLNGYSYVSSFSDDRTDVKLEDVKKITINSSNKIDVLRIMGEPSCKILCPSISFSADCQKGKEIWIWIFFDPFGTEKNKKSLITFDGNGVVAQISSATGQ